MNGATPSNGSTPISSIDFNYIRALVYRESSIVLDDSKTYLVNSRLLPIARAAGVSSVGPLISLLQSKPFGDLHQRVVEAVATTETSFFRDVHPFTALRDHVIPELVQLRQSGSRTLNIWSAACSSGQEPHSIAMILKDKFPQLHDWDLQLLASDISRTMLARARQGTYTQLEVNRGLPAPYLVRFFSQNEDSWQLDREVREMFRFFEQNIAAAWKALPPIDLLVMRNVLIYFDVSTRRKVLNKVKEVLRPGGYLLLGSAETTLNLDESFARVRVGRAIFYRISKGDAK
ncbi:MAG: protein-glutamate O-methyltransferase CheR [Acidobacteriota bacterium]